jgi:hypothetical protein
MLTERVEGECDSLVGRKLLPFLTGLGECSTVEIRADFGERVLVVFREPWQRAGAEVLMDWPPNSGAAWRPSRGDPLLEGRGQGGRGESQH